VRRIEETHGHHQQPGVGIEVVFEGVPTRGGDGDGAMIRVLGIRVAGLAVVAGANHKPLGAGTGTKPVRRGVEARVKDKIAPKVSVGPVDGRAEVKPRPVGPLAGYIEIDRHRGRVLLERGRHRRAGAEVVAAPARGGAAGAALA